MQKYNYFKKVSYKYIKGIKKMLFIINRLKNIAILIIEGYF